MLYADPRSCDSGLLPLYRIALTSIIAFPTRWNLNPRHSMLKLIVRVQVDHKSNPASKGSPLKLYRHFEDVNSGLSWTNPSLSELVNLGSHQKHKCPQCTHKLVGEWFHQLRPVIASGSPINGGRDGNRTRNRSASGITL